MLEPRRITGVWDTVKVQVKCLVECLAFLAKFCPLLISVEAEIRIREGRERKHLSVASSFS